MYSLTETPTRTPKRHRTQARALCTCCGNVCRYGEWYCLGCKAEHGNAPAPSAGVGSGRTTCTLAAAARQEAPPAPARRQPSAEALARVAMVAL